MRTLRPTGMNLKMLNNSTSEKKSAVWCKRYRESRTLILLLVCLGFFLDYTLLSTIVPIIPELLYNIEHPGCPLPVSQNNSTTVSHNFSSILHNISSSIDNVTEFSNITLGTHDEIVSGTLRNNLSHNDIKSLLSHILFGTHNKAHAVNTTVSWKNQTDSYLMYETVKIGFLSSSKFVVQLFVTPLVGQLLPKYGYNGFMLYGFASLFSACITPNLTLKKTESISKTSLVSIMQCHFFNWGNYHGLIIFAFGETYLLLVIAKCLQGYGAACLSVSGLTMLADIYQDHKERGAAIGLSLQGLALGNLIGPLFGGVMYELIGKVEPFLILAAISFVAICLQLSVIKPKCEKREIIPNSIINIIKDPYIVLTSVTLMMANMGNTLLESILPVWMMGTMHARRWQQGAIFTPFSMFYLISTYIFAMYHLNMKRWLTAMVGMILTGASFFVIPITKKVYELISPMAVLGIAAGMVESAMLPELGFLVDARHSAGYASVYAVGDLALCIGDTIAPLFGGILVNQIGFTSTLFLVGFLCIIFSPCISLLKAQEEKGERELLLSSKKRKISVVAKKVAVLTNL